MEREKEMYSHSVETEASLSMLRRSLVKCLQSMNLDLFKAELTHLLACEYANLVLMSGLDQEGRTALHLAVEAKFEEAVRLILATDMIDLHAPAGENAWTVLHYAVDSEDVNIVRHILHLYKKSSSSTSSSMQLSPSRSRLILKLLRQPTGSSVGGTALHLAVRRNNIQLAATLLESANCLWNMVKNPCGNKRRHANDSSNDSDVSSESGGMEEEDEDDDDDDNEDAQIDETWKASAKLTRLKDKFGDTPLHWAVKANNYALARLLCSYGANPKQCHNMQGQTPFIIAKYILRNSKMVKLLKSFHSKNPMEDGENSKIVNTPDDQVVELDLPGSDPKRVAANSDGAARGVGAKIRLRRNAVVAETPPFEKQQRQQQETEEVEEKRKVRLLQAPNSRPYLHREVKVSTEVTPIASHPCRLRTQSLKIGPRDVESMYSSRRLMPWPTIVDTKVDRWVSRKSSVSLILPESSKPVTPIFQTQILNHPLQLYSSSANSRRKASIMDPFEYYPMASSRRGICMIINNMTYWHPKFKDRGGCDKDEARIEKVFSSLGFLVKVLRNLSSGEIQAQLHYVGTSTDHSGYDCFVTIVMAHGGLGEIIGVDGMPLPVHQLTMDFTADRCSSLAGKPKLFFIQACRGEEYQLGYALPSRPSSDDPPKIILNPIRRNPNPLAIKHVSHDAPLMTLTEPNISTLSEEVDELEPAVVAASLPHRQRLIPSFADFLLSYATIAGFKAQRDPNEGSAYIQTLCYYLERQGRRRSLLDIVTSVHRVVTEKVFREAAFAGDEGIIFQQTPEVRHTLTRRVQFV